jgi:hypothetical protein
MKKVKCNFTSVWGDGSEIVTPCVYNPKTGEVDAEKVDENPDGGLTREFITLPNGEEKEVCKFCHGFVLKTVVGDHADLSFGESEECSDPDCESNF